LASGNRDNGILDHDSVKVKKDQGGSKSDPFVPINEGMILAEMEGAYKVRNFSHLLP
jgi:hypothetical protein